MYETKHRLCDNIQPNSPLVGEPGVYAGVLDATLKKAQSTKLQAHLRTNYRLKRMRNEVHEAGRRTW